MNGVILTRKPKLYIGWLGEDDSRTIDCHLPRRGRQKPADPLSGVPVRPTHGNALDGQRRGNGGKP